MLDRFGADGKLVTRLAGAGPVDDGVFDGDLYLVGGGDPTFGSTDEIESRYDGTGGHADELVDALRTAGIERVTGRILGDGSRFDDQTEPTGGLGGLVYDRGVHDDPALWAARQFTDLLERRGITVDGAPGTGTAPAGADVLASVESPPMSRLVQLTLKPSDNFLAEMLLKNLDAAGGEQATTAGGAAKATAFAATLGARVHLRDGQGRFGNQASAEDVVALLRAVHDLPAFPALWDGLPIAGVDGTLADRMRNTPAQDICRAKTGTNAPSVTALSGFCQAPGGHRIVFSILMNLTAIDSSRRAQNRMTAAIARYSAAMAGSVSELVPAESSDEAAAALRHVFDVELTDPVVAEGAGVYVLDAATQRALVRHDERRTTGRATAKAA